MAKRRLLIPILLFGLLLVACAVPENIEIGVTAPITISQLQRFQIEATARNTGSAVQTLVSLDIADEYLQGIVIESSTPPFANAFHVPIDNTMSYSFDLPIQPGAEVTVLFQAFAAHPGDFAGEVDFCINSETSFVSYPVRTIVQ